MTGQPAVRSELSPRELDVLDGLAKGLTNRQIGRALFLSEDTVKTHLSRLYAKLGATCRSAAVATAFRQGMVS